MEPRMCTFSFPIYDYPTPMISQFTINCIYKYRSQTFNASAHLNCWNKEVYFFIRTFLKNFWVHIHIVRVLDWVQMFLKQDWIDCNIDTSIIIKFLLYSCNRICFRCDNKISRDGGALFQRQYCHNILNIGLQG